MPGNSPKNFLSILLVEDHLDTAQAIGHFLMALGHSVRTADSVETAVKNVVEHQFDLIISDVGLPDGNGVSLMHGIRPFCSTPAIALTGYSGEDDIARCKRAGFNLHLTKPIDPATLQEAISSIQSSSSSSS